MEITSKMVDAALESTTPGEGPYTLEQTLDFSGADTARRVVKAALEAAMQAATPAPASDEVLAELEEFLGQAAPAPWFVVPDSDDFGNSYLLTPQADTPNGDAGNPNDFASFSFQDDAKLAAALRNAAPALLARVRQAEAKVAPAGIWSNGQLLNALIELAKVYRLSAQASITRNSHMHDLALGEEAVPDQSQIDAVLTNFLNHIGISRGVDLGLYSSDLATVKGGQQDA